ncbi:MAG: hypothetical protein KatS3mg052_0768 [Candidatus Roseilinea sp.]|nr:MAG: hypothetical protein KatS3mg052_0768 [Candidatus Roseilinea sp.]
MAFLARLLRLVALCVMMALLLAAVPLVVSAERQARPAAQRLAREAAQTQPRQVTAPEDARQAASPAVAPTLPTAPSSRVAAVAQAPAQPVRVQPTVAASLPQDAPDAAVYDAKSVPMRRGKVD